MRQFFPLRVAVIIGIITATVLLSAAIFYLTAVRFHRLTEGAMAVWLAGQGRSAAVLWSDGVPAKEVAKAVMADSAVLEVRFHFNDGRWQSFGSHDTARISSGTRAFHHLLETPSDSVTEMGYARGLLHTGGHRLAFVAACDSGTVEITVTTARINAGVAQLVRWGNWIIIFLVLVAGAGVLLIDRRLRRIVNRMIATTNRIATGRLEERLQVRTGDALEELSESFNRLTEALAVKQAEVDRAHAELSSTIAQRTAELREERDRLTRILDNLPTAFILFDRELKVQATSSAVGNQAAIVFDEDSDPGCRCKLRSGGAAECVVREAHRRGAAVTGRLAQVTLNGSQRILEHSAFPVRHEEQIVGWLETITDVTEREHQQERLIRVERLSVAGELAATLAHEIRNHLTSAKLLLQIDADSANLKPSHRDHLARVIESIQDMERMVEELLAFARPAPVVKTPVDADELIRSVADLVQPTADKSGITVSIENRARHKTVRMDVNKLRRALVNLLFNAIQATPQGGRVQLTADWAEEHAPTERISHMTFLVEDTGPGVPVELREKVFEPFFTTRPSGVGLGLAMVKQVAQDHGGTVRLEESSSGGAIFKMVIPTGDDA